MANKKAEQPNKKGDKEEEQCRLCINRQNGEDNEILRYTNRLTHRCSGGKNTGVSLTSGSKRKKGTTQAAVPGV